jgi:hypothetical protein
VSDVLPQLDELLFFSVDEVSVVSVEVTDTAVRVEARTTARQAACPGCGAGQGEYTALTCGFPRDLPATGKLFVMSLRVRWLLTVDSSERHTLRELAATCENTTVGNEQVSPPADGAGP